MVAVIVAMDHVAGAGMRALSGCVSARNFASADASEKYLKIFREDFGVASSSR
jgi:hypothetical protein